MPNYYDARKNVTFYDMKKLEDLYLKTLNKNNIDFLNMDFFKNYMEHLSMEYLIKGSKNGKIPFVYYKGSKLQISNNNFPFLKFLSFHLGYLAYLDAYQKHDLKTFPIKNEMLETYIIKSFYDCLNQTKKKLGSKVDELNDFELISNLCVKERLTAYNFLMSSNDKKRKEVKDYLNSEYISILRGTKNPPKFDKSYTSVSFYDIFEVYRSKDYNDHSLNI